MSGRGSYRGRDCDGSIRSNTGSRPSGTGDMDDWTTDPAIRAAPAQRDNREDDWGSWDTPQGGHTQQSKHEEELSSWDDWTTPAPNPTPQGRGHHAPGSLDSLAPGRAKQARITSPSDDWGASPEQPFHSTRPSSQHCHRGASGNTNAAPSYQGGGGGNNGRSRSVGSSGSTKTIMVPTGVVGRIIGKGGIKINELQEQSGARIRVSRDNDGGAEVAVQVTGSGEQQGKAETLIRELIQDDQYAAGVRHTNTKSSSVVPMADTESVLVDWGAVIKNSIEATKMRWAQAPEICKSFYVEDPAVAVMRREDVDRFRLTRNNITVSHFKEEDNRPIPNPVTTFAQAFSHYPELLEAVENQKFPEPSPIQCQTWPILLKGYDMIGIAQTGTGKTLAFLLPAMVHIEGQPIPRDQRDGPTVLIMAPTRELAQQIEREVKKFPYKGIKCLCVYGGGDRRQQITAVAKGVEIVVATPGRLYDLMQAGALKTTSVSYVVLDEADRMLDLGFEPQIKKILLDVRPDRQTVMTSATWPEGVRRIAKDYMDDPLQVCVGTLDLAAVHSIEQHVVILGEEEKQQSLLNFIHSLGTEDKAIVFVGRKIVADQIASELSLSGISCQCIHGDRDQIDREQALEDLRSGAVKLLVATDVASRGIDIKDITHILNYDFPRHAEEYVHRVGRTGRAGRSGIALSFFTREDWAKAPDLVKILQEAGQEVPEELVKMSERYLAWKERKDEERRNIAIDMGGSRGGGRGCHKCGEEGHFARECPRGDGGGSNRGSGRGCHKCGEEGHFARECPRGGRSVGGAGRSGGSGGGRRGRSGYGSDFF